MMQDDWKAEEEAFAALSRERTPSRFLEERTVRALKERGLIRSSPLRLSSPWMAATAVAASIALFAGGVALGQWIGARQTVNAVVALYPDGPERAAARVQQTGSAHTAALAALVAAADSAGAGDVLQAREVAVAALWAAAAEVIRLAPDDPLAARILQAFERQAETRSSAEGERNVVWF